MVKSRLLLLVPILLTACQASDKPAGSGAPGEVATAADSVAEEQAIRKQIARWLELIKAKDAASIAALYTDDGAIMPPNSPIAKGHAEVQKAWAGMMQMPGFELNFVSDVIVLSASGDMAMDRGTYRMTVTPDGKPQTDTGKYVVVWRKVGGEWKAAADIINSDLPAGGG